MRGAKAASLAGTLLFAKGFASPNGFAVPAPAPRLRPAFQVSHPYRQFPPADLPETGGPEMGGPEIGGPEIGRPETGGNEPRGPRVRLSFRVDAERHLRMKLAMAHLKQTGQDLVIAALDHYLRQVVPMLLSGPCACLEHGDGHVCDSGAEPCGRPSAGRRT